MSDTTPDTKPAAVKFTDLGLCAPILKKLERQDYVNPTPIQAQAIPLILAGKDVVGLAQTGTGKTAAFTLPVLHNLSKKYLKEGADLYDRPIRMLILTPTRELALQIDKAVKNYGENLTTRSGCVVGGVHAHKQKKMLRGGVDILVATPGRLEDLHSQGIVDLSNIDTVVLDEADQMLDIGFMPAIKRILSLTPKTRQTLLFSATMPRQIQELSKRYMRNPEQIAVATISSTAEKVKQSVMFVPQAAKTTTLIALAKKHKGERIIVFVRTKRGADRVAKRLNAQNLAAAPIHGNRSQNQRTKALAAFRTGEIPILVATDVAARGIDIPGVELVVNFDLPQVAEAYVHRIGRTGRAGKSGIAIMFCADEEMGMLSEIERTIKKNIPVMNADGSVQSEDKWAPSERSYSGSKGNKKSRSQRKTAKAAKESKPDRSRNHDVETSTDTPDNYKQAHNSQTSAQRTGSGERRKPRNPQRPHAKSKGQRGQGKPRVEGGGSSEGQGFARSNTGRQNTGGQNTGNANTGNANTGGQNTGGQNTGGQNTGGKAVAGKKRRNRPGSKARQRIRNDKN
ncbi:MAG: RNA helicase [Robiginitomaculum sp.]|nr:MAG: RNA helicase [Robiginitomaculum sp.]